MLEKNDFSAFHRIQSDETWHFYTGSPLLLYIISPDGHLKCIQISNQLKEEHFLQYTVPYGHWFAAELEDKSGFALLGCSVSPGFDFKDFEMAEKTEMLTLYPKHKEIIDRLCK